MKVNPSKNVDVLIVGAGLAGLSAAVALHKAGIHVCVIEGSKEVGGRVKTTKRDGYILDHGFQVFNPAYSNASEILDYSKLHLRKFSPGVNIVSESGSTKLGNPILDPTFAISFLKHPEKFADLAKFGLYCSSLLDFMKTKPNQEETDAHTALQRAGMSENFIANTLQPFLSGVFLEADMKTSSKFLEFVLQYFLKGTPAVPAFGMGSIAEQLASQLPSDSIQLSNPAHGIEGTTVRTDSGSISANHVIVATDQETTAAWLGTKSRGWQSVITWYHSTDIAREHLAGGKALLHVDSAKRGPVLNTVPLSHAASSYAPTGKHLISTSTLGLDNSLARENQVREHLALIYGVDTQDFQTIDVFTIEKALPVSTVPLVQLTDIEVRPNVFVAGDSFTNPSIDGAIESGRLAANAIIAKRL